MIKIIYFFPINGLDSKPSWSVLKYWLFRISVRTYNPNWPFTFLEWTVPFTSSNVNGTVEKVSMTRLRPPSGLYGSTGVSKNDTTTILEVPNNLVYTWKNKDVQKRTDKKGYRRHGPWGTNVDLKTECTTVGRIHVSILSRP